MCFCLIFRYNELYVMAVMYVCLSSFLVMTTLGPRITLQSKMVHSLLKNKNKNHNVTMTQTQTARAALVQFNKTY